jgi:hypothetical protein
VGLFYIFWINDGIENSLVRRHSTLVRLCLDCLLNGFHFLWCAKLVNQIGKILDIVFIIHFCKFFKNYKLVDARVNLFAPVLLKFNESFLELIKFGRLLLQVIVGLSEALLITCLPLSSNTYSIHHTLM